MKKLNKNYIKSKKNCVFFTLVSSRNSSIQLEEVTKKNPGNGNQADFKRRSNNLACASSNIRHYNGRCLYNIRERNKFMGLVCFLLIKAEP